LISVYYIRSETDLAPGQWLDELPAEARARVSRMHQPRDRWQSLAGLQMLKKGLLEMGFSDYSLTELTFTPGHKPCCGRAVDFNVSHSGNLVACALSDAGRVGLDIEQIRPINPDSFQLYLTPAERRWVSGDTSRFFTLWTGKESVVKAHGRGGLHEIQNVELSGNRARLHSTDWHVETLDLLPEYRASLAFEAAASPPSVEVRQLLSEHLIPVDA
jgi:4'-phosphopantetheinyl transferase